jgi:hypothetical protein
MSKISINGWSVIPRWGHPMLDTKFIPGTSRRITMRKDVLPYFLAFAADYHKWIAPIDTGTFDDWSYHPPRTGRASNKISDHSSGTALDLNATREGAQRASNKQWWARAQKKRALRRLRNIYGLLAWGGDYKNFYDPMHWYLKPYSNINQVREAMKRLGITPDGVRRNNRFGRPIKVK